MMKIMATATKDGREIKVVVLGLSHRNLDLLRDKKPIVINGRDVGLPGTEIIIFSGETEHHMQQELACLVQAKESSLQWPKE